ncbi:hydrogenase maturation protease [Mycobacterium xenopi RIVM700367]|nr:hydrogenase maturation protease [Mycobacterium xenopi RIVM700367]
MTDVVIIGLGNSFRRDDGVGIAVSTRIAEHAVPGVRVVTGAGEPTVIVDAWKCAARAVVVDAAIGNDVTPGRIRRWSAHDLEVSPTVSSHALGLAQTWALGEALDQLPAELMVFTVDAADTGHGVGLTPAVAAAVPKLVDTILVELNY